MMVAGAIGTLKSNTSISFGDQVRHPKYPEWGTGAVTKVEQTAIDGNPATRVSVRFKNAGLKTFAGNTLPVEVLVSDYVMPGDQDISRPAIAEVEDLEESGLTQAVQQKLQEIMLSLPLGCRDPFNTVEYRLNRTLDLYKYDLSGKGLMEWAMVQTGMDDPLSRFNRTELEAYFKQFACERDQHLGRILQEKGANELDLDALFQDVPAAAIRILKQFRS